MHISMKNLNLPWANVTKADIVKGCVALTMCDFDRYSRTGFSPETGAFQIPLVIGDLDG